MANRVFQNVVYQMKEAVDRVLGVVDETGTVISCSELGQIGEVRDGVAAARQAGGEAFVRDGYSYHQFSQRLRRLCRGHRPHGRAVRRHALGQLAVHQAVP